MLELSLFAIVLLVLMLPLTVHRVEKDLEIFLFIMGVLAVTCSHFLGTEPLWSFHLIEEALVEPVMISAAVLVFGVLIYFFKNAITGSIVRVEHRIGSKLFTFAIVVVLGLLSSIITAIIAAIILVEVVSCLRFDRKFETRLIVLGCFSIGLGAALTPIGEPLSTIAVAKLRGEPYHAGFFFLVRTIGAFIVPGVLALGLIGALIQPSVREDGYESLAERDVETLTDIFLRAGKVYLFVMALIFLGTGFKPIIDAYIINLPGTALYWINTVSAVLDNATLAAAEISPKMSIPQLQSALVGLLIAGGMLIPGNIPNIICAGRLGIRSKDWARIALPLGTVLLVIYFVVFILIQ